MTVERIPGASATLRHGWWHAHRWLVLRRLAQLAFFALFAAGPWFGVWLAKGNLASSLTLELLPLTDPLILLQGLLAGHAPQAAAVTGALIVLVVYGVLGGRLYCSWVCPVNIVTDLAAWLRRRLGVDKGWVVKPQMRRWMLAAILLASALSGTIAFELINPITTLWRTLLFGLSWGAATVALIFLFDVFVARHGWCGHLCPVGAFYGLLNHTAMLRVSAAGRDRCDDCMDCFAVCPEMQVIPAALRGGRVKPGREPASPVVLSADCTACGRCIDVCPEQVFRFVHRFDHRLESPRRATAANGSNPTEAAREAA